MSGVTCQVSLTGLPGLVNKAFDITDISHFTSDRMTDLETNGEKAVYRKMTDFKKKIALVEVRLYSHDCTTAN